MSDAVDKARAWDAIAEKNAEIARLESVLRSHGFRRCDIPACNCGSWHHTGGYAERFREIQDAVVEAGYSTNGKVLLDVINEIIAHAAHSQAVRSEP